MTHCINYDPTSYTCDLHLDLAKGEQCVDHYYLCEMFTPPEEKGKYIVFWTFKCDEDDEGLNCHKECDSFNEMQAIYKKINSTKLLEFDKAYVIARRIKEEELAGNV